MQLLPCTNGRCVQHAFLRALRIAATCQLQQTVTVSVTEYFDERVCLSLYPCVCLCVCLSTIISSELHVRSSPNVLCVLPVAVARSSSGGVVHTLCTSSFMDDVIFAHKPMLLDVAAQLKRSAASAHAALGLAINCAQ